MHVHTGHDHDPMLMALSVLIAIQGSFVSLVLARGDLIPGRSPPISLDGLII